MNVIALEKIANKWSLPFRNCSSYHVSASSFSLLHTLETDFSNIIVIGSWSLGFVTYALCELLTVHFSHT